MAVQHVSFHACWAIKRTSPSSSRPTHIDQHENFWHEFQLITDISRETDRWTKFLPCRFRSVRLVMRWHDTQPKTLIAARTQGRTWIEMRNLFLVITCLQHTVRRRYHVRFSPMKHPTPAATSRHSTLTGLCGLSQDICRCLGGSMQASSSHRHEDTLSQKTLRTATKNMTLCK